MKSQTLKMLSGFLICSLLGLFTRIAWADSVPLPINTTPGVYIYIPDISYTSDIYGNGLGLFEARSSILDVTPASGSTYFTYGNFDLQAEVDSTGRAITASLLITEFGASQPLFSSGSVDGTSGLDGSAAVAPSSNPNFISMSIGTTDPVSGYPIFGFEFRQQGGSLVPAGTAIGVNLYGLGLSNDLPTLFTSTFDPEVDGGNAGSISTPLPPPSLGGVGLLLFSMVLFLIKRGRLFVLGLLTSATL